MHWWTHGQDGSLYVIDDDGENFGLGWSFSHLLKVEGVPPNHRITELSSFRGLGIKDGLEPGGDYAASYKKLGYSRYVGAPIAIGARIYATVYDYDWSITPPDPAILDVLSVHRGVAGIIWSHDEGKTWHGVPPHGQPPFLGPRFAALHFLNFGPGYAGVPAELGDYLYAVSNDGNWESGDALYLARVPPSRILDRSAWEFFAGFLPGAGDSRPAFTRDEAAARPILADPGRCGHSTMSFNPGLGRYLLAAFSDTVPHDRNVTGAVAFGTWDKRTELQLYEAERPWGPFRLVHDERPWGGPDHTAYLPTIPSPWLSKDGLSGWLVFSGDWTARKDGEDWYAYMVQPFRLLPR